MSSLLRICPILGRCPAVCSDSVFYRPITDSLIVMWWNEKVSATYRLLRDVFATCCEKPKAARKYLVPCGRLAVSSKTRRLSKPIVIRKYLVTNWFASYCQRLTFLLSVVRRENPLYWQPWAACKSKISTCNIRPFMVENSIVRL